MRVDNGLGRSRLSWLPWVLGAATGAALALVAAHYGAWHSPWYAFIGSL